jgi:hypothetical protein
MAAQDSYFPALVSNVCCSIEAAMLHEHYDTALNKSPKLFLSQWPVFCLVMTLTCRNGRLV